MTEKQTLDLITESAVFAPPEPIFTPQPTHQPTESTPIPRDIRNFFDRIIVINLRRDTHRLAEFQRQFSRLTPPWPFATEPEIFQAIDGNLIPQSPRHTQDAGGVLGCRLSHERALELAFTDRLDNILIFEDDAVFLEDFSTKISEFLQIVPADWDQIMLGGQHMGKTQTVIPGVIITRNCQRTHAYAVRGKFMEELYRTWRSTSGHIDHRMGEIQYRYRVYAPDPFLVGQGAGWSNISGAINPVKFWNPPQPGRQLVFLEAPRRIYEHLRAYGLHSGYTIDHETGYDVGLMQIAAEKPNFNTRKLRDWLDTIAWEVESTSWQTSCIWHPDLNLDAIKAAAPPDVEIIHVKATSIDNALQTYTPRNGLQACIKSPHFRSMSKIVNLKCSRSVKERLVNKGWHFGRWIDDEISGIDNGLRRIEAIEDQTKRQTELERWIWLVGREAEKITDGVLAVWCKGISDDDVRGATLREVVPITATGVEDAISQWEAATAVAQ